MVFLSKIYTKRGDDGGTELGNGLRVEKFSNRVEAYGTVDELNSAIGMVFCVAPDDLLKERITSIQNDLFDVGADLCVPEESIKKTGKGPLRVQKSLTKRLEREIDEMNNNIAPIKSFVLPGGSVIASQLHFCRAICRRAERRVAKLMLKEEINTEVLRYLNRLSDWFFVAARKSNKNGKADILWQPAKNIE